MRLLGKWKKGKKHVKRWYIELLMLGVLLVPIWFFILWIQDSTSLDPAGEFLRKALVGIVAGVLAIAIWVLGSSVIIINILRDILVELRNDKKPDQNS